MLAGLFASAAPGMLRAMLAMPALFAAWALARLLGVPGDTEAIAAVTTVALWILYGILLAVARPRWVWYATLATLVLFHAMSFRICVWLAERGWHP